MVLNEDKTNMKNMVLNDEDSFVLFFFDSLADCNSLEVNARTLPLYRNSDRRIFSVREELLG